MLTIFGLVLLYGFIKLLRRLFGLFRGQRQRVILEKRRAIEVEAQRVEAEQRVEQERLKVERAQREALSKRTTVSEVVEPYLRFSPPSKWEAQLGAERVVLPPQPPSEPCSPTEQARRIARKTEPFRERSVF